MQNAYLGNNKNKQVFYGVFRKFLWVFSPCDFPTRCYRSVQRLNEITVHHTNLTLYLATALWPHPTLVTYVIFASVASTVLALRSPPPSVLNLDNFPYCIHLNRAESANSASSSSLGCNAMKNAFASVFLDGAAYDNQNPK